MGRKKKKVLKPWCWYCNREFDDEKVLIYHQKAKHFKCNVCGKKLYTGPGLAIHSMQVHKQAIKAIPNSILNRGDPDIEIYGTEGIPFKDTLERAKHMNVEIDLRNRELAAAALPAKFERTLDAPYGTPTIRTIQPTSPSVTLPGTQSILKNYNSPLGNSSATPGESNQGDSAHRFSAVFNGNDPPGAANILPFDPSLMSLPKTSIDRIIPPTDKSKIYHPIENISLEEYRIRFPKYVSFKPSPFVQPMHNYPIDGANYNYNIAQFPGRPEMYQQQQFNNFNQFMPMPPPPVGFLGYPPPELALAQMNGTIPFQQPMMPQQMMGYNNQPQYNMDMHNPPPDNYYQQR